MNARQERERKIMKRKKIGFDKERKRFKRWMKTKKKERKRNGKEKAMRKYG